MKSLIHSESSHIHAIMNEIEIEDISHLGFIYQFAIDKAQQKWDFRFNKEGNYHWINMGAKKISTTYPHKEELLRILEIFKYCL